MAEIVEDGRTGLLFEPGDAEDLARAMREAVANPARMREMGRAARAVYERTYTPRENLERLTQIYLDAMAAVRHG